jgi:hypothetical protein
MFLALVLGMAVLNIAITFIYLVTVKQVFAATQIETIDIVGTFAKIRCASGVELVIPPETRLVYSEHRVGTKRIVKVPESLNSVCEFGLLKYERPDNGISPVRVAPPFSRQKLSKTRRRVESSLEKKSVKNPKDLRWAGHQNEASKKVHRKTQKYAQIAVEMNYASKCSQEVVGVDGLGDWGRFVKAELSSGQYQELLSNKKAFRKVCPGFDFMNRNEKKNVWVFILMSMSHYESSCRPTVEAQGPNGTAKGLLQLHEGAENKYSHWDREGICKKGDSKKPKDSLQCTLAMLNGQLERFDSLFFEKSYWDVLRNVKDPSTHAAKIKLAIRKLPGCSYRSVASAGQAMRPLSGN